jgi:tetratricopeptide (TPR) repeat protein
MLKGKKSSVALIVVVCIIILSALTIFVSSLLRDKKIDLADKTIMVLDTGKLTPDQKYIYTQIQSKLEQNPTDHSALLNLGRLKQSAGDYEGAEQIFLGLRESKPKDVLVLNSLGDLYMTMENYEKAEDVYMNILQITPKWLNSYEELLVIYRDHLTDRVTMLEPLLTTGIEKYPEMDVTLMGMMAMYYDEIVPDKEKAIEYYEAILVKAPDSPLVDQRLSELKQ